jgi:hypothetical protein
MGGRALPAGARLAHYRIVRLLGQGGMGAVGAIHYHAGRRAVAEDMRRAARATFVAWCLLR